MPVTHITEGPGQKWNEGQGHSDQQQGIHHLFVAGMNWSEIEKEGKLSFALQRYFLNFFPLLYTVSNRVLSIKNNQFTQNFILLFYLSC